MKSNRFVVIGVILSVAMSAAALSLQIQKSEDRRPFAKYFRPIQSSGLQESDYRALRAEVAMLREWIQSRDGIAPPSMITYSDDKRIAAISIAVDRSQLPPNLERSVTAFKKVAANAISAAAYEFRLEYGTNNLNSIRGADFEVEFVDMDSVGKAVNRMSDQEWNRDPNAALMKANRSGIFATFKSGQLTMR